MSIEPKELTKELIRSLNLCGEAGTEFSDALKYHIGYPDNGRWRNSPLLIIAVSSGLVTIRHKGLVTVHTADSQIPPWVVRVKKEFTKYGYLVDFNGQDVPHSITIRFA